MTSADDYETLIRKRLPSWLAQRLDEPEIRIVSATRLAGGFSNETWNIQCEYGPAGALQSIEFILRWSPEGSLYYPSDIPGQFALLESLGQTSIPAPAPLWLELDADVLGEPFLTMKLVPGSTGPRVFPLDDPQRHEKLEEYVRALTDIHALDWRQFGLSSVLDEPTTESCARDALDIVIDRVTSRGVADNPVAKRTIAWLSARIPESSEVTLIHGDPNLSNYRFCGTSVVGILDWDLARLSDPMWDVGFVCGALAKFFVDEPPKVQQSETQRFLDLYEDASGRSVENLEFWQGLYTLRAAASSSHPAMRSNQSSVYWNLLELLDA